MSNDQPKQGKLTPEQIEILGSVGLPVNIESLPLFDLIAGLCMAGLLAQGMTQKTAAAKAAVDNTEALLKELAERRPKPPKQGKDK